MTKGCKIPPGWNTEEAAQYVLECAIEWEDDSDPTGLNSDDDLRGAVDLYKKCRRRDKRRLAAAKTKE